MKAYLATGENANVICAFDKNAARALRKVARFIKNMEQFDDSLLLLGVNVAYDEEAFYCVTATVTSARY